MYRITWTEVTTHEVEISAEELARIKGISTAELAELDNDETEDGLADDLANLEDDGFAGLLTREDIEVAAS